MVLSTTGATASIAALIPCLDARCPHPFPSFDCHRRRLARPGGLRSVVAESLLVKHQLRIPNRGSKRAPPALCTRPHTSLWGGGSFVCVDAYPAAIEVLLRGPVAGDYTSSVGNRIDDSEDDGDEKGPGKAAGLQRWNCIAWIDPIVWPRRGSEMDQIWGQSSSWWTIRDLLRHLCLARTRFVSNVAVVAPEKEHRADGEQGWNPLERSRDCLILGAKNGMGRRDESARSRASRK